MNKLYTIISKPLALAAVLIVVLSSQLKAQLTGTLTVPSGTVTSLAIAINELNTQGVGAGGVVIDLLAGNPETAPLGGYSITASGTAADQIIIRGNGNIITAPTPQVTNSRNDALIKIVGGDYITIDGFTLRENAANTTTAVATNNMTEYGVAIFPASATNGAQNNTIINNAITLSNATIGYQNSIGIFSSSASANTPTGVSVAQDATSIAGTNSNNKFYSNTISGVAYGLYFLTTPQTATVFESGTDIGGTSSATGNTITFGVSNTASDLAHPRFNATAQSGIYFRNLVAANVRFNTITNLNTTTLALGGIFHSIAAAPTGITYTVNESDNNITLTNNSTTAITGIEFGSGLANATRIANNNAITLNQNPSTAVSANAIAINSAYTASVNTVLSNTITINQSTSGTGVTSSALRGIEVGGTAALIDVLNNSISFNQTTSSSSAVTGAITGIRATIASTLVNIGSIGNGNTIKINQNVSGSGTYAGGTVTYIDITAGHVNANAVGNNFNTASSTIRSTGTLIGVRCDGTVTQLYNIKGNIANIDRIATSGSVFFTNQTASPSNVADTVSNNSISFTGLTGTSIVTAISQLGGPGGGGAKSICNNTISISGTHSGTSKGISWGYSSIARVGSNRVTINCSSPTMIAIDGVTGAGASNGVYSNTINISSDVTSPTSVIGINAGATGPYNIYNNTFSNIALTGIISGAPVVSGIVISVGTNNNIYNNTITNINVGAASSSANPVIDGVLVSGGTSTNIYQNKIHGISTLCNSASGTVNGIRISGGTTNNVYNNLIGGLNFTTSFNPDGVRGISITSTGANTSHNIYNNSIYLSGTSSGFDFGSSGIFHAASATATTARLDLQNNMIFNMCTPVGTGKAVAFRRSSGAAGTLANYSNASNRNLFYVPTGGSSFIYSDGTTDVATISAYITSTITAGTVAPRDAASFTESAFVPAAFFVSTTPSNTNYLKPNNGITTQAESGGATLPTFTVDYAGVARPASPGTSYDIGAWEFNGVTPAPVVSFNSATPTLTPALCVAGNRAISVNVTTAAGTISAATLVYSFNGVFQPTVAMTNSSGNIWEGTILAPSTPTGNATVTWTVTAVNSLGLSNTFIGASYSDEPTNGVATSATSNPSVICAGGTSNLTLVANKIGTRTIGDNSGTSITTTGTPYRTGSTAGFEIKNQYLILASELVAAGFKPGNLTSLAFNVSTAAPTGTMTNFSIDLAQSTATVLTATYLTPTFSNVYFIAQYAPVTGINTHVFNTPFNWDGVSNIVINTCATLSNTGGGTTLVTSTTPAGIIATVGNAATGGCSSVTGTTLANRRPQFIISGNLSNSLSNFNWSDGVGTIGNTNPVIITSTATTSYTGTATLDNCPVSAVVQVSVNPLPTAITFTNSAQCGVGTPTAMVADANGFASPVYNWYNASTGGTLLQTGTSNTYTSAINTITVFYVSVPNPTTTCESPRAAVTASVTIPDAISAVSSNTTVCLGQSLTLTAANTATAPTQNYTYTWQSSAGSGAETPLTGASVVITPSATGSFVYNVTGVDGACTALANVNVTINSLPTITVTSTPTMICSGSNVNLNALTTGIGAGTVAIGTGTTVTTSTGEITAFNNRRISYRMQTVYSAAELQAAGLVAGNITSIAYRITTLGDAANTTLYTVKCGTTSLNSLTDFVNSAGFTTVFNPATYNHAVGLNTINFNTPYLWDGVSNIVIEVSHNGADAINNAQTFFTTTPSMMLAYSFNGNATGTPSTNRLNIIFGGQTSTSVSAGFDWTWNPGSINTNSAIVNPTNTGTLASTQVYTATVTNILTGCSNTATASVVVNPIPADPIATNATQCGIGVPTSSVSGSVGYNWYASPTSSTVLQTGASSNFTSSIGATTTWYVSSFNGNCESVNRTAVTTTVSLPDPITASASSSNLCIGGANTITLTAAPTNTATNYTSYTWMPSSTIGSGMTSTVSGASQIITPDQVGNYTYSVTVTDGICTALNSVTVSLNSIPSIGASANPSLVCSGSQATLNAQSNILSTGTVAIGTGTNVTGATTQPTAFCNRWSSYRMQTIYTAAELQAAGLSAGNITSIGYRITTLGSASNTTLYTVKCGTTALSTLTDFVNSAGFTTVFNPTTYNHSVGLNTINFNTPYLWDGVSNIIIEVSHNGANSINNSQTFFTTTASAMLAFSTNGSATGTPSTSRLNIVFGGQISNNVTNTFSWQWNPGSINTNIAVVNPTNTGTVASTEIYTATVTSTLTGCSNTATVGVLVNPLPSSPVAFDATQCGVSVPTASVSGGTNYRWYASPTSTTVLQSGSASNFTTSINSTTTWFVSSFNGICESPRVALTQTVTSPPALSVIVPTAAICQNAIEAMQITSTVSDYSSYVWTPSTNLFTDAAATVAYTGGNASILYYKSSNTSSVNYSIVATNSVSGCVNTTTSSVSTEVLNIFATANPTLVCSGSQVNLSAVSGGMGTVAIGTGSLTTSTSGNTPYSSNWEGSRSQYLITAAELQAMNLVAGNINSLAFFVTSAGSGAFAQQGFNIKIVHTSNTSIGPGYGTPNGSFVTVFGPVVQPAPTVGLNNYNFTTPFNWDGVSNILIDICHDNDVNGTCPSCFSGNSTVRYTATSFNSVFGSYDDDAPGCGVQAASSTSNYVNRPNMILSGVVGGTPAGYTWQWNPGAVNGNTVSVNPINPGTTSITVIYTVSATNTVSTCANTQTVAVVVNPVPVTPIASDATQCGLGIPTASVTSGPILNWFATPSSTLVLQTGSAPNFTTPINTTTTWYVSASNGLCSSPRTAVTQTVTPPPALSVTSLTNAVCADVTQTLSVTSNVPDFDSYVWAPLTGLYSDASATVPYNGTSATAVYFKSTVNGTSNYTIVATNTVGACTNFTTTSVTVDVPQIVTTANPAVVCNGANTLLDARNYIQGPQTLPSGYCAATGSGTTACVNLVRLGTINRISNCETGSYINVPETDQTTYLSLGRIYTFSVTTSTSAIVSVWIDWNRNGTFETTEWYQPYTTGTNGSAIITVPGTASLGLTKMRVKSRPTGLANGNSTSCTALSGEVEDYVVNIVNDQSSSYTWQWNPGAINSNTTSVLASNPGTSPITNSYTVTITNTVTACTNSQAVTFTVNPTPVVGINPSSSAICIGNSATLTASGSANSFTWSPAGGNASATIVTPTAQATYTLIGEALGCTANATTTINVNALPAVNALASSTAAICAGTSETLTSAGSATNFTWSPSGITSGNAVVNPTVTTTYTLTGNDGICSNTANVTVTVTPLPTLNVAASNTIICLGNTSNATLTASGTSSTYTWSPIVNNTATAVVTPTASAIYTVTGEALGCTNTRTIEIAVSSAPSLSVVALGGANICAGNSGTLSAAGSALNFTWTPVGGNGVTAVITPTASTETYTLIGEANGCTSQASITVTVNAIPTVTATAANGTICNGENTVLTANTSATTFSWSSGANTASTTVTPTTTTVYTVTVIENGCSGETTVTVNVNACTGIEEQLAKDINLYPNPTTGLLNIVIPEEMVSKSIIEMYDGLGKLVAREELTKTTTKVYMNKLEEGMYFYKIISDTKEMRVGKVIKH
jgi:hypothetical protein